MAGYSEFAIDIFCVRLHHVEPDGRIGTGDRKKGPMVVTHL
jgi:hypothetical protein